MRAPDEADSRLAGLGGSLAGRSVCVNGLGVSGPPVARVLAARGARVTAVDGRDDQGNRQVADELAALGVTVVLGPEPRLPVGTDLVITTPGWRPGTPLLAAATAAGIPVMGDVELAWRLRPVLPGGARQDWLAVTGTNGKTTTVRMLAAMLGAAGHRTIAAGNVGLSVVDAVTEPEPYPVIAVELSSFQLHWSSSLRPFAAVVLNVAAHHLDWHGDIESYARAKGRIYGQGTVAVCNADDRRSAELAAAAAGTARVVAFRLGAPGPGELGIAGGSGGVVPRGASTVGDVLLDRAFGEPDGEGSSGVILADVGDVRPQVPHNVADALAAAALARAYGAPPAAIRAGLAAFQPEPHRMTLVARVGGVDYVDDSKASNPHAAAASLASYPSVVWIAGGLFRGAGADIDRLVDGAAPRLRAVVLLGADRGVIRRSLERLAPGVPVAEVVGADASAMDDVVAQAARLAVPGDTVVLAPAAQSFDMFRDYPARGDAFAAAVRRQAEGEPTSGRGLAAPHRKKS
ncbi:MAG TPA: UDP-N-acetylmuramoyl-L-alanine--D-glutamate ligase [Streptosporangiaceae bacterium]|nr:UDP-N-acetylmuramoyl-L-alanine--D-glutamate ligase [Streptosporangiaceae bacterium]